MNLTRVVAAIALCLVSIRALAGTASESVLLFDEHTVARTSNLTQQFFPAAKHPANPVMTRTEAWEGTGPYPWGTSLMQDPQTRELRLWYVAFEPATNFYRWGYATSRDMLTWTKPNLGQATYQGKPASNCLSVGAHPEKACSSIARDPRPQTPPARRYLGIRFTYAGERVAFSPDGIKWTEYEHNPVWHVPSDIIHVMWDERRNCFTAYYKLWELKGTRVMDDGREQPFVAQMSTFTPKKIAPDKTEFEAPVVHFHPDSAAEVKDETFVLRAGNQGKDDGGGTSLSGAWTAKRVQGWASSDDGIHWGHERVILRADEHDTPTANIQYMLVIRQGGYYLGFLTLHDESGLFRIHLAHSADGLDWRRPSRRPWLDIGPAGAFDSGMVLGPAAPVSFEREQWFPYGGFDTHHDSTSTDWHSAIGMATMRLDGYASWRTSEGKEGELVTQPFKCDGDRLFVNADATKGSVAVEVLGEDGKPVAGFEASACKPIRGETLAKDGDGWVQWSTKSDLKDVEGKTITLRFVVKDADLFAFRIADEKTIHLPVPRATDR